LVFVLELGRALSEIDFAGKNRAKKNTGETSGALLVFPVKLLVTGYLFC
jgi:hypothetical protein